MPGYRGVGFFSFLPDGELYHLYPLNILNALRLLRTLLKNLTFVIFRLVVLRFGSLGTAPLYLHTIPYNQ